MADTLYVKLPGGVIAPLEDGTRAHLTYGDKIPENIDPEWDPKPFTDKTKRKPDVDELQRLEANRRAALAEGGQVNASSSPVPGNYSELDEDGAAQFMASLSLQPEQQAAVVLHEQVFGGNRQKVIDAAGDYAKASAGVLADSLPESVTDTTEGIAESESVVPLPDGLAGGIVREDAERRVAEASEAQIPALTGSTPPADKSGETPPPPPPAAKPAPGPAS